mgnify:CR=1 FL=1
MMGAVTLGCSHGGQNQVVQEQTEMKALVECEGRWSIAKCEGQFVEGCVYAV